VPGRSIHTNLQLLRDAIEYANTSETPLAVISLDQESAFGSVEIDIGTGYSTDLALGQASYRASKQCTMELRDSSK
jgi:hypothetical protein